MIRSSEQRAFLRIPLLVLVLTLVGAGAGNADTWHLGDLTTYTQSSWGGEPDIDPGAALLSAHFDSIYAGTGGVIVGSLSGFTMVFTDPSSVLAYLPAIGPFAPLNGNVLNPISTASGGFGGKVLGLEFNVDFSDSGFLPGASDWRLPICGARLAFGVPFVNTLQQFR